MPRTGKAAVTVINRHNKLNKQRKENENKYGMGRTRGLIKKITEIQGNIYPNISMIKKTKKKKIYWRKKIQRKDSTNIQSCAIKIPKLLKLTNM